MDKQNNNMIDLANALNNVPNDDSPLNVYEEIVNDHSRFIDFILDSNLEKE